MSDLDELKKLIDDYARMMHSLEDAVAEHKDSEASLINIIGDNAKTDNYYKVKETYEEIKRMLDE